MDFLAVIHGEDRMMDILKAAEDRGLYMQDMHRVSAGDAVCLSCGGQIPVAKHGHRMRAWKSCAVQCMWMPDSSITKNAKDIWRVLSR